MTSMTMNDFGISRKDCVRIVPPGSKHIRNFQFSEDDLDELDAMNVRTFLFSSGKRGAFSCSIEVYRTWRKASNYSSV